MHPSRQSSGRSIQQHRLSQALPRARAISLMAVAGLGLSLTACEKREQATAPQDHAAAGDTKIPAAQQPEPEKTQPTAGAPLPGPSPAKSVEALVAECQRLISEEASFAEINDAYKKLALADPALALEHCADTALFWKIGPALFGVFETVAKTDPDLLVKWMGESLPHLENRDHAVAFICVTLDKLAKLHPDKAVAAFDKLNLPETEKQSVIAAMFRGLAKNDPSSVIAKASSLDPAFASSALAGAADGATENTPRMAQQIAEAITDAEIRRGTIDRVFAGWFKKDPAEAKASFMKMDPKVVEEILVAGAKDSISTHSTLSQKDPLTLLSLLDDVYPTAANKWLFESSVMATVKAQPEQTFSTISKLPEGELKSKLFGEAYSTLARVNPEKALELFSQEKDPASRAIALPQVASSIGLTGMDTTLRFVNGLGSDEEKSQALSAAFNAITHKDVDSAADYLENVSSQPVQLSVQEKEQGYKVVGYILQGKNPQSAREWMYKLPPAEQPHAMFGIAIQMAERDAKGLGEFLNTLKKDQVWASGVEVMISTVEATDAGMANQWKQALKDANLKLR